MLDALIFSLGNYFVFTSLSYLNFPSGEEQACCLTSKDIEAIHFLCDDKIGRFNSYNAFADAIEFIAEKKITQLKDNKKSYEYQRTLIFPSNIELFLHEYSCGSERFYILDESSTFQNEFDFDNNKSIGFALDVNPFKEFDFELIRIISINDSFSPYYDCLKGGYWFFKTRCSSFF